MRTHSVQRWLVLQGSLLFAVGLFTGIWSGLALNGTMNVASPHLALAAHLNALMGGLWLLGVAFTLPFMGYDEVQKRRLAWLCLVPAWGNWAITLVASGIGVNGLAYNGNRLNNIVAFLLQTVVVLPSLVGGIYWLRGLWKGPKDEQHTGSVVPDHRLASHG